MSLNANGGVFPSIILHLVRKVALQQGGFLLEVVHFVFIFTTKVLLSTAEI